MWLLLARHGVAHDDPETAERGFRRALELEPDSTAVRGELVRLLVSRQRVGDAVQVVEDGLRLNPDDAVLLRLEKALAGDR